MTQLGMAGKYISPEIEQPHPKKMPGHKNGQLVFQHFPRARFLHDCFGSAPCRQWIEMLSFYCHVLWAKKRWKRRWHGVVILALASNMRREPQEYPNPWEECWIGQEVLVFSHVLAILHGLQKQCDSRFWTLLNLALGCFRADYQSFIMEISSVGGTRMSISII